MKYKYVGNENESFNFILSDGRHIVNTFIGFTIETDHTELEQKLLATKKFKKIRTK